MSTNIILGNYPSKFKIKLNPIFGIKCLPFNEAKCLSAYCVDSLLFVAKTITSLIQCMVLPIYILEFCNISPVLLILNLLVELQREER